MRRPQVYIELRKLAAAKVRNEADGQTLDATAPVNEAWLKLNADSFSSKGPPRWRCDEYSSITLVPRRPINE